MANYRQIHTQIWKDDWFIDLKPDEKVLFIYLFSNESTSMSGLYKLSFRVICFETGIEAKRAEEILGNFAAAGKVYYSDGVVWIVNMRKYHSSKSIKVTTRIKKDLEMVPGCALKEQYLYHMDTISKVVGLDEKEDKIKEDEKEDKILDDNDTSFGALLDAFIQSSGIPETMLAHSSHMETVKKWVSSGVRVADVTRAVTILDGKGYTITRPASIDNALIVVLQDRKEVPVRQARTQKIQHPDGTIEEVEVL